MKKWCVVVLLLLAISFTGCGKEKIELQSGNYVLEEENVLAKAALQLDAETGVCSFFFDPLSSYISLGTYKCSGEKLVMTTDDGKLSYSFRIVSSHTLEFLPEESDSTMRTAEGTSLPAGSLFEWERTP